MIELYAQSYDGSAKGFYFKSENEYAVKAKMNRNEFGEPVEEYEIQFIDGETIDCALAKAWGLYQSNFAAFLAKAEEWEDWQKINYIIAVGECGECHDRVVDDPDQVDLTVYECDTMKELAEQFVEEGLFGDIPNHFECYIDYDAIARDLSVDYSEITIAGTNYIFHCA